MAIYGPTPDEIRTRLRLMQLSNQPWSQVEMMDPAETRRQLEELSNQPWEDVRMRLEPHPLRGVLPEFVKERFPEQFPEYSTGSRPAETGRVFAPDETIMDMVQSHGELPDDPASLVSKPPGEINIEGLTVDPDTGEVVDLMDPEQRMMGISVPAGQGPLPMQTQLINKLDLIRAQAAMKGRGGSLQSAEGAQPDSSDWKPATGGSFSQSEMTPEIQKRLDDNMMFAAESDENFASWMLQTPEIRERMKYNPALIGEALRNLSEQKSDAARKTLGMRIIELGVGESGLLSPQAASSYEVLVGEKPPDGMVGVDRVTASQKLYQIRSQINALVAQTSQGIMGPQASIFADYSQRAIKALDDAEKQLQGNADPNMVLQRVYAMLAASPMQQRDPTASLSTRPSGDPTKPPIGVASIGE